MLAGKFAPKRDSQPDQAMPTIMRGKRKASQGGDPGTIFQMNFSQKGF